MSADFEWQLLCARIGFFPWSLVERRQGWRIGEPYRAHGEWRVPICQLDDQAGPCIGRERVLS